MVGYKNEYKYHCSNRVYRVITTLLENPKIYVLVYNDLVIAVQYAYESNNYSIFKNNLFTLSPNYPV